MYFLLLSLFSLLETLWWWMLLCLMLSHRSLKLSSLLKLSSFCCSVWVRFIVFQFLTLSASSSGLLWTPLVYFFIYCILQLCDLSSVLSYVFFLLKFSLCSSILLPCLVSIIMTIILNSLSSKEFSSLLRVFFVLWFWNILLYFFTVPDSPYFFPMY